MNVLDLIADKMSDMSKGQKKIADYILLNIKDAAFMTADVLGEKTLTSESTVVRFAYKLGFSGYSELQKELANSLKQNIDISKTKSRLSLTADDSELMTKVLANDAKNINDTMKMIKNSVFNMAIDLIVNAKKVYIIGLRNSKPLASILDFYLNLYRKNVINITTNATAEIFEQMIHISDEDVVIGISFPDYNIRTLHALEYASEKRASIVTITDSDDSPVSMYSACNLSANCEMTNNIVSMTAPLSVVNALIVALSFVYNDSLNNNLAEINRIVDNFCDVDM